jgi:hypothetical protein
MKNKIYVPTKGVDSWKELLANPTKQSKPGFSARTLANCWEIGVQENGFPEEFGQPLNDLGFHLKVLLAIPEYKVSLNNEKAPSQNDLFVLCKEVNSNELIVVMVEGKVSESFDKSIKNWYLNKSSGKKTRFEFLAEKLKINPNISDYDLLRYQLFHRTVSAILTAEEFCVKKAMILVHSFSSENKWHEDYSAFAKTLNPNLRAEVGSIEYCKTLNSDNDKTLNSGIELYIGWIKGNSKYLKM